MNALEYWARLGRIAPKGIKAQRAYRACTRLLRIGSRGEVAMFKVVTRLAGLFGDETDPMAREVWQIAYRLATRGGPGEQVPKAIASFGDYALDHHQTV